MKGERDTFEEQAKRPPDNGHGRSGADLDCDTHKQPGERTIKKTHKYLTPMTRTLKGMKIVYPKPTLISQRWSTGTLVGLHSQGQCLMRW